MNRRRYCAAGALALLSLAQAADQTTSEDWTGTKPIKGTYQVYGGTLSERLPPTAKDRKVSFMFKGPFAQDLFNQIGPDVKKEDACSSAKDYRERQRGDLDCVYTKDSGYTCYMGLNVVNGKSTYGAIC